MLLTDICGRKIHRMSIAHCGRHLDQKFAVGRQPDASECSFRKILLMPYQTVSHGLIVLREHATFEE